MRRKHAHVWTLHTKHAQRRDNLAKKVQPRSPLQYAHGFSTLIRGAEIKKLTNNVTSTHPSLGMRSAAVGGASLTLVGARRRRACSPSALAFSRASTAAYSAWIAAVSDERGCARETKPVASTHTHTGHDRWTVKPKEENVTGAKGRVKNAISTRCRAIPSYKHSSSQRGSTAWHEWHGMASRGPAASADQKPILWRERLSYVQHRTLLLLRIY